MKRVEKNTVVRLEYHVLDDSGNLVDSGRHPIVYLHGGYGELFAVLEKALEGKTIGQSIEVLLKPEESFGEYDEKLLVMEPLDFFPDEVEVGNTVFRHSPRSAKHGKTYRVCEIINDETVLLDGNHRLAGQTLIFVATIADIRYASAREIAVGAAVQTD